MDMETELLLEYLKGEGIILRYGSKVRLAPVVSNNQLPMTKERNHRCQAQHKQILNRIKKEYRGGIKILDSVLENLRKKFRQLILLETNMEGNFIFVLVDCKFYSSEKYYTCQSYTRRRLTTK